MAQSSFAGKIPVARDFGTCQSKRCGGASLIGFGKSGHICKIRKGFSSSKPTIFCIYILFSGIRIISTIFGFKLIKQRKSQHKKLGEEFTIELSGKGGMTDIIFDCNDLRLFKKEYEKWGVSNDKIKSLSVLRE